jgi:hypothetical protein
MAIQNGAVCADKPNRDEQDEQELLSENGNVGDREREYGEEEQRCLEDLLDGL